MTEKIKPATLDKPKDASVDLQMENRLVHLKSVLLPALDETRTRYCLDGQTYYSRRNPDIDTWFTEMQPAPPDGAVSIDQLAEQLNSLQLLCVALKVPDDTLPDQAGELLKIRGHLLTLTQLHLMIRKQEGGEDIGLCTDGSDNIVPALGIFGRAVMLSTSRRYDRWFNHVREIGKPVVWGPGCRLLLVRPDASNL